MVIVKPPCANAVERYSSPRTPTAWYNKLVTLDGRTVAVVTLEADQVRAVNSREIPHARELVVA